MFSPILAMVSLIASAVVRSPMRRGEDLVDVRAGIERDIGNHLDQALEQVVAGDEIGLRIDLDQRRPWCRRCATPMSPSAATRPAFLAALARPFLRSQSTAASRSPLGLVERRLAIHHARAGLFAELFHHACGDVRHFQSL